MAGNRLGPRAKIIYESEAVGKVYILTVDASFVVAGAGVGAAAPDIYNPTTPLPPGIDVCPPPKSFNPRGVWVKSADGKARKFVVCASATAELYATTFPVQVVIDTETFVSTGRVGEKQSF
jgi:hypothetical protein